MNRSRLASSIMVSDRISLHLSRHNRPSAHISHPFATFAPILLAYHNGPSALTSSSWIPPFFGSQAGRIRDTATPDAGYRPFPDGVYRNSSSVWALGCCLWGRCDLGARDSLVPSYNLFQRMSEALEIGYRRSTKSMSFV